jgi:transcriptional regulator with XRE-family HTH domain
LKRAGAISLISPVKIKSRLASKLRQHAFRRRFFRARAQEEIAQQIRELRERRELRQIDLAKSAKMKQSAISRIEQTGYSAWTFKTLLRVADALDAQVRVIFEAAEDVIARYEREEEQPVTVASAWVRLNEPPSTIVAAQLVYPLQGKQGEQDENAGIFSPFYGTFEVDPHPLDLFYKPVERQGYSGVPQVRTQPSGQELLGQ